MPRLKLQASAILNFNLLFMHIYRHTPQTHMMLHFGVHQGVHQSIHGGQKVKGQLARVDSFLLL